MRRLFWAVLAIAACKTADDLPLDQVDAKDLAREKAKVAKGVVIGEALRAPRITVDAATLRVGERVLGARGDLASAPKLEPFGVWMKGLREHWKTLYPGRDFTADAEVTLPADVGYEDGANLVRTLAYAGYPNVRVKIGGTTLPIHYAVLGPIACDDGEGPVKRAVAFNDSGGWRARADSVRGIGPVECTAWRPVTIANAASTASAICSGACDVVVVTKTARFEDAARIIASAAGPHTEVRFDAVEACP